MSKPTLYLTRHLPDPVMTALTERFRLTQPPEAAPPNRDILLAGIRDADALICTLAEQIDASMLAEASQLRIIANYAVGYNNIDMDAARTRNIIVTNTPDILTESTADLTWALLLATARRVPEGHGLVQNGAWTGWEPRQLLGTDVFGHTLGIIGMGRIGQAVARRAVGFNMPVLYYTRTAKDFADQPSWKSTALDDVLTRADFLTLHVPLSPDTHHLIGPRELQLMRPTAYLINVARGAVVDEAALVTVLRKGRLAGAGLDVYEHEPLIHPGLLALSHVVTLPHLGSATHATRIRMGMVCLDNVCAVMEGRQAPNRVA
ncbi:MAG: D-glycerate dehydrogenase [Nitrospirales bacterium]